MQPLVIVPARTGSKGVPNKNFRKLPDGSSLFTRATAIGQQIGQVVVTSDAPDVQGHFKWLQVGAPLHQDDTPMSAVVQHVLDQIPGEPDQPIVLLQPTTPLRQVEPIQRYVAMVQAAPRRSGLATVREIPEKYWRARLIDAFANDDGRAVPRRQDAVPLFILSGTAYVWTRRFGWPVHWDAVPESYEPYVNVDTPEDWDRLCAIIRAQMPV